MKIAVIGAGISGNLVARLLHDDHEVTLFESADYPGGHTWCNAAPPASSVDTRATSMVRHLNPKSLVMRGANQGDLHCRRDIEDMLAEPGIWALSCGCYLQRAAARPPVRCRF